MKKVFLSLQVAVIAVFAIGFTSCLGDSENSYAAETWIYVGSGAGEKIGHFQYGYLRGNNGEYDEAGASVGDIIFAKFKVNYDKNPNTAYYDPDYLILDPEQKFSPTGRVYRSDEYFPVIPEEGADLPDENEIFNSLRLELYYPSDHYGDRWMFQYSYNGLEGEPTELNIIFNPENQNASELAEGTCILDVVLVRNGGGQGTTITSRSETVVVDMSSMRGYLKTYAVTSTQSVSLVNFRLRYYMKQTSSSAEYDYYVYDRPSEYYTAFTYVSE